ncbi:hypothetical protein ACFOOP_12815 [Marinicaulis aureus]|uniref:Uncharacterized protein n=1 Tax=Hyphococcus aureus TaxID=2666033 RepID=A0ABW1L2K7_9PROT
MRKSIFKSFAVAAGMGLALGFAHAHAAPSLPFGGGSALFADSGSDASTDQASSALENMMQRFIRIDAEETAAAGVETESSECPEEKKTKLAESDKDEKSDKSAPQGPEPIYFAF